MSEFLFVNLALTPAEFAEYVRTYNFGTVPPDSLVLHHTAIPAASWAPAGHPDSYWDAGEWGMSLEQIRAKRLRQLGNLKRYYHEDLGWTAGPHLVVDNHFIYLMTPMYNIGIHAKWGNSFTQGGKLHYSIGLEVIGNYTKVTWPASVAANVGAAVRALQQRLQTFTLDYMYADGLKPGRAVNSKGVEYCPYPNRLRWGGIASHRDFNKPACPGDAITEAFYLQVIRSEGVTPAGSITADSPILAAPRATIDQCARYMLARPHGDYTEHDIATVIVPAYFTVCQSVGVDPLIAIAQMVHETGNLSSAWSQRPHRNPAGIGVTGEAGAGLSFADWARDSIPAHVGRLLAYALPLGQGAPAQQQLLARSLSVRGLPVTYRGSAPTLRGLTGRWAMDPAYADKLASVANAIRGAN